LAYDAIASCANVADPVSRKRNMKTVAAALLVVVVAGLSWSAHAEMLALRCEGTKTTFPYPLGKPSDLTKNFAREEPPDMPTTRKTEPFSTDVIVTGDKRGDLSGHGFGVEFDAGYVNDALVSFGYTVHHSKFPALILDGLYGKIDRITGILEATWGKHGNSG
jgi:hypothetical protein